MARISKAQSSSFLGISESPLSGCLCMSDLSASASQPIMSETAIAENEMTVVTPVTPVPYLLAQMW